MRSEELTYEALCQKEPPLASEPKGIVVASDVSQEWLLPWWWDRYKVHNSYPVTFVDLGLSLEKKQWCKERGSYVSLPISGLFVSEKKDLSDETIALWEQAHGKHLWSSRAAWFRKPLACLQSPYEQSLWIDLDCEIRGPLEEIFSFCNHPSGLSAVREFWRGKTLGINSGVLAFRRNAAFLREWARLAFEKHSEVKGDQDLLDRMEEEQKIQFGVLPSCYNWSRVHGDNAKALIFHWHGHPGKTVIAHQIFRENSPF
jgi:hypothetical protein